MCGSSVSSRPSVETKFLMYGNIRIRAARNPDDTQRFKDEVTAAHRILGNNGIVCRYYERNVQAGITIVPPRSGYTGMYLKNFIPLVS